MYLSISLNREVILQSINNTSTSERFLEFGNSRVNYYPFGMVQPGRTGNSSNYRYGFNGMESDDEFKGNESSLDFGARILDPRVGRWLSLDPLASKFPGFSPYNYTLNNPILFVDPDGKEPTIKGTTGVSALIKTLNDNNVHDLASFEHFYRGNFNKSGSYTGSTSDSKASGLEQIIKNKE